MSNKKFVTKILCFHKVTKEFILQWKRIQKFDIRTLFFA